MRTCRIPCALGVLLSLQVGCTCQSGGVMLSSLVAGRYVVSRIASPWKRVKLIELEAAGNEAREPSVSRLRIGAFNIAHGRGTATGNWRGGNREARAARLSEIARLLRDKRLDIAVLNEVDFDSAWSGHVDQARTVAQEAGFRYCVEQRNMNFAFPFCRFRFGNAILAKYPVTEACLVDYPARSFWENILAGKKRGLLCTLELSPGVSIRVLAVHLEHRSESVRVRSAEVIERLRKESDLPLFAVGDFNSSPAGYPLAETDESGRSAIDVLLGGGSFTTLPEGQPGVNDFTFPSTGPDRVIDWVLVPTGWTIVSKEVPAVELSDHRPVVAEIAADAEPAEDADQAVRQD